MRLQPKHRSLSLTRIIVSRLLTKILFFGILGITACSSSNQSILKPGPAIPRLNLTGGYDCTQFGFITLKQTSNTVQGTYEGIRAQGNGTIQGRIEGDLIWFQWVEPGDLDSAILPKKGSGWLRIKEKGQLLEGRWGYGDQREGGGKVVAERSEYKE